MEIYVENRNFTMQCSLLLVTGTDSQVTLAIIFNQFWIYFRSTNGTTKQLSWIPNEIVEMEKY